MYLLVVAAVLGVAALFFFLFDSDVGRSGGRGHAIPEADGDGPREGGASGTDSAAAGLRGRNRIAGEIALTIVVTSDGQPVADAAVVVTGPRVWRASTNAVGRIDAPWLIPGKYAIVATKEHQSTARTIVIEERDREVELALRDGVLIRGSILAADGSPIAGARIHAEPTSEQTSAAPQWRLSWLAASAHPAVFAETRSGEDGSYELVLPTVGSYILRVSAARFGGASEVAREYTEALDDLDFYLQPGALLKGVVVDSSGQPVACALVVVNASSRGSQHTEIEVTDGVGAFVMSSPLGSWSHMMVRASGFASTTVGMVQPPAEGLRVTLDRGAAYRVRFVTKGTDEPIEGVEAMIQTAGGGTSGTSGPDGVARFENVAVARGTYGAAWRSLTAACKGYIPMQRNLDQAQPVEGVIEAGDIELERGATIRGRVTDAATGSGIEGAELRPFSMTVMRFQNVPITAVRSDAFGRYEMTGVPEDTVAVLALHPDYSSPRNRQELFALTRDPKNRLLAPGQLLITQDVGLIPTYSVRGLVLDPEGKPLAGAVVTGPWRSGASGSPGASNVVSGKDGTFELAGYAKDRKIHIRVTHRNFAGAASQSVTVGSGEAVELQLQPGASVQGLIVDPDGQPVSGATVTVSNPPATSQRRPRGFAPVTSVTNDKGVFVVRNVVAGERLLHVMHNLFKGDSKTISVPDDGTTLDAGTMSLERGLGVGGRVYDADGAGVAGVMVTASWFQEAGGANPAAPRPPGSAPVFERTNANVMSDAEGRFAMYGLKDGSYRITVAAAGRYASSPTARSGNSEIRVEVKNPAVIRGRVTSGGKPVKQAWVQATQPGANPKQPRWLCNVSTGEDGAFELGPLPPEETFSIKVNHAQFRTLEIASTTAAAAPRDLVLDPGASITGTVVDDAGSPIANARLSVAPADDEGGNRNKWAQTGEDGAFRADGLEPGRYRVTVMRTPAMHVPSTPVETETDAAALRFVLVAGQRIKGVIQTDDRDKLGQVRILVLDKDGNNKGNAWIWAPRSLEFTIGALPPGKYTVKAVRGWPPDEETLAEMPDVEAGDENLEIHIRGK